MKISLKSILATSVVVATFAAAAPASAMPLAYGGLANARSLTPKAEVARLVCNYRGRCYRRYGYNGYGYRRPYNYYYGPRVGIGGLGFGFY